MPEETYSVEGGSANVAQSELIDLSFEHGSSNEGPTLDPEKLRKTSSRTGVTEDTETAVEEILQQARKTEKNRRRVDTLASRVQEQQGSLEDVVFQTTRLDTRLDRIEQLVKLNESKLESQKDSHDEVKERVTQIEDRLEGMEAAAEADQINIHTVEFIYRGVMLTGVGISIVAAIAFGIAFQLVTVTLALVLVTAFFVWSYKRGLKPANA